MLERLNPGRPTRVIGWDGRPLTLNDLPASHAVRWNAARKAEVVAAVRGNLLSFDEAMRRYCLSPHEFIIWERELFAQLARRRRKSERRDLHVLARKSAATAGRWRRAG
jgi:hypothetical protein